GDRLLGIDLMHNLPHRRDEPVALAAMADDEILRVEDAGILIVDLRCRHVQLRLGVPFQSTDLDVADDADDGPGLPTMLERLADRILPAPVALDEGRAHDCTPGPVAGVGVFEVAPPA